jgi:RNA polymerase sigma-70 factor, ECF subfamily
MSPKKAAAIGPSPVPPPNYDPSWDSTIHVLEKAKGGDRSAVRILIERARPPLRRWTHGRLPDYARDSANTEDIVQDAVLRTLKHLETFEHRTVDALQKYLRTAVVNGIRDAVRRVRRRGVAAELSENLHDAGPSPEVQAILSQRSEKFIEALGRLRPVDRQLLVWRIELGYSNEEIAQRSGKTVDAVGMAVNRAVKRLRMKMEPGTSQ